MSEWRPIETHDGSSDEVIGGSATENWSCAMERHGDVWRCSNNPPTDAWGRDIYPTHWMPLPSPPSATEKP